MIEIQGLSAGYAGMDVIQDVSFTAPEGKVTIIVGPNGCGKTTLLRSLLGAVPRQEGRILVDGRNILTMSPRERARKVSYLAQSKQIPEISALRMVLHGRFPYLGYPRRYTAKDMELAREAMNRMGIGDLEQSRLATLSGGTRQKVYIAMVLAQNAPAILMDEPTTFLDVSCQVQMMHQARTLAAEGKAVVMVLHDLTMALQMADQIVVLDKGKLVSRGTPEEVYTDGCLDRVFGVRVSRFQTENRWQYYYREIF